MPQVIFITSPYDIPEEECLANRRTPEEQAAFEAQLKAESAAYWASRRPGQCRECEADAAPGSPTCYNCIWW